MVLSLTATGIQSDVADAGTYTWADVVALSSPFLTTHTQASGRPFYRWTGLLLIQGSATLNAWLIALELLGTSSTNPGIIQARGTAKVNFGRKRTINSKPFYDRSCQIIVTRTRYLSASANAATDAPTAPLSNSLDGASSINIYNSQIAVGDINNITDSTKRVYLILKSFENSSFVGERVPPFGGSNGALIGLSVNGSCQNSSMVNGFLEVPNPSGIIFRGSGFYDSGLSVYNDAASNRLEVEGFEQNLEFLPDPTAAYVTNGVDYLNSPNYSLANQLIYNFSGGTIQNHKKSYSHDLKIKSGVSNIQDALVVYTGRTNASFTSAVSGLVSQFKLIAQETDLASTSSNGTSYNKPLTLIDYSAYTRQIRSYLHENILETIAVDSQVGSPALPFTISLAVDSGITQTVQATAAAVTGIAHTASTITVSTSRSIAEIYDSRKAYWRDNGGTPGVRIGTIADFGNLSITIATGAAISSSAAKFADGVQTSGILTLTDPRAYNGVPFSVASGGSVVVAPGNTDLRGWLFASGSTINASSGTAIVTVDASQLASITAGTGVTIQAPTATIRFHGMPTVSNTILFVQDLTTNTIIYPTIANGEAIVNVNAARNYKIRADAPGYLASSFVTISGASVDYQFGLTDYRSLYLSGVNRSSQITFNPTTYLITISDVTPALSFADVFVTIEDYLATPQGLNYTAHPYPVILPDRNILQFPYDTTANAINPARIKPAATNTTDPALLFETYLERAADPSYGLFDFSTSNGRIIRIRSVVAIAQVASATIAPSQQQIRDALTIPASVTVVAGSIDSKLALIPTTDASIPIAAIKVQTDKFVFTTVGRVDATAIGVPTNPLITTDSRLSNLDALVSSRATQVSINALPTLTAIEGSIVLFKSSNYTAPDNAGIGSLNSKLTTIRTDGLDRLPNLDALITSRATPDQVWAVSYLSLTQVGTIGRLLYWIGKMFGATSTPVTASNTARTTGDGTINQTITTNPDGSKTMSGNP